MDDVARHARALLDDDEMVRLRGIAGLARHPGDPTAVAELMESVKNDVLGELSIVAAVALAGMHRTVPGVARAVADKYDDTVGSIALDGDHDPTLRLTYFFAVAGLRDFFQSARTADFPVAHRVSVTRYFAAGRDGDIPAAAGLMVWFEGVSDPRLFRLARRRLPGWRHWFAALARSARVH